MILQVEPLIFSSVWIAISVVILVIAGSIIQASFGMGFGLTVAPMLALLDPALVPAATLYVGMLSALFGMGREWKSIAWSEVKIGVVGRVFGGLMGAVVILHLPDRQTFSLVFGIVIAVGVGLSVSGWHIPFSKLNLLAMSSVSGLMGIITSVGAPPMALVYQNRDPMKARPTMAAFFAIGCLISLSGLYIIGVAGMRDAVFAAFMLPPMLVGTFLGRRIGNFSGRGFRYGLLALSGAAAAMLICRGAGYW